MIVQTLLHIWFVLVLLGLWTFTSPALDADRTWKERLILFLLALVWPFFAIGFAAFALFVFIMAKIEEGQAE